MKPRQLMAGMTPRASEGHYQWVAPVIGPG
ncbi:hypothetical protein BH20CHL3_BH20CHL3_05560 [soil metagenome]